MKVDGTGRSSFTGLFSRRAALSLAVFESSLYWVDDGGLWQVPHSRPDQKRFISKAVLPVLAVHHQLQQPRGALRFNSNLSVAAAVSSTRTEAAHVQTFCCHGSGSSACANDPCHLCQLTKGSPVGFTCTCPNSKVLLLDGTCDGRLAETEPCLVAVSDRLLTGVTVSDLFVFPQIPGFYTPP